MSNKIIKIPINREQRLINENGQGYVPCEVSSRWLQFPNESQIVDGKELMFVDVMTYDINQEKRKICNLCLSREDIIRALYNVKTVK